MLRKIEETRRLADKMKKARRQNEEKLEQMQIRDQLATTEKLEKQIRVLEQRKERAVYQEVQQKKLKEGVRKETEKVKEELVKNKGLIEQQSLIEM